MYLFSCRDLDLWPLTLKTFSAVPNYMVNICAKFRWSISTKYGDITSRRTAVNRRTAHGLPPGMGVDHGGTGGTSLPPEFGARGTLMQIVPPPRFCHIGTKMSVLWPSKYAKIRFRPGLCPGPRWWSSRHSPRSLSRLERGHPSPYLTPLGTDPPSALAMRPPRSPARSTPMPPGQPENIRLSPPVSGW